MKIILLLIAHFLGDFLLQSDTVAREKRTNTLYYILHCGIYFICIIPICAMYGTVGEVVLSSILIAFFHSVIDGVKIAIKKEESIALYLLDQLLHFITIIVVSSGMPDPNALGDYLSQFLQQQIPQISSINIIMALLFYLICSAPAGVTIKLILSKVHVSDIKLKHKDDSHIDDKDELVAKENALTEPMLDNGFVICILERFCILTLAILGQFTAISFVIAAKSLARIRKLEDEEFAEKYLVGTFLSVLFAVGCGCLFSIFAI